MSKRYTWGAHGAPLGQLYVVDWEHPDGPTVIAALPDLGEESAEAAKAIVRLLETPPRGTVTIGDFEEGNQ